MSSSPGVHVICIAQFLFPFLDPTTQNYCVMFLLCSMPLKWIRYCLRHCSQRDIAVRTQRSRVVQHPPDLSWAEGCNRCCFSGKWWTRQNPFAAGAESILLQKAWCSAKAGPRQLWTLCLLRKGEISAVASAKLSWRVGAGEFILWLHAAAGSEVPNSYHTGESKTFLRKKGFDTMVSPCLFIPCHGGHHLLPGYNLYQHSFLLLKIQH